MWIIDLERNKNLECRSMAGFVSSRDPTIGSHVLPFGSYLGYTVAAHNGTNCNQELIIALDAQEFFLSPSSHIHFLTSIH